VTHLHAVLRKAFRDAVIVDEIISSNPVERAKRPRVIRTAEAAAADIFAEAVKAA
jgi:hypothetical protein